MVGGVCGFGGHAWLQGACMVAGGVHGCGGVCGCRGVCMVLGGWGMHGCRGVMHGWGRGHTWLGGAWLWGACVAAGGVCRIRQETVNERAVRILLECILVLHRLARLAIDVTYFISGFINTLLSLKSWEPLARLCYLVYLLHPMVIFIFDMNMQQTIMANHWIMVSFNFICSSVSL